MQPRKVKNGVKVAMEIFFLTFFVFYGILYIKDRGREKRNQEIFYNAKEKKRRATQEIRLTLYQGPQKRTSHRK